jgi:UPF0271 protein
VTTPEPPAAVDLNADLGEGCPWDDPLLARVTSASVCCGAHAGDPGAIAATLRAASRLGVVVGAHPGYADRENFGRRERPIARGEAESLVREQVAALGAIAGPLGVAIRFLKPHGALYNQAQREPGVAAGVVAAASALGLPILGQPGGAVEAEARASGVRFVAEGFADRAYRPDGRLVPRGEPGAVLTDRGAIAAQVLRLVDRGFETLCLHGDRPEAVALADLVRESLDRAGLRVAPFLAPG